MLVDTINKDKHFGDYPSDLEFDGKYFYVTGRHAGLSIYRYEQGGHVVHIKSIQTGYTPTNIHIDKNHKILILVGNEDFIKVDISNPEKPKRYKSCKITNCDLAGQYAECDKEYVVAGCSIHGDPSKTILGFVDISEDSPKLIKKTILSSISTKSRSNDGVNGIIYSDPYIILSGYYKQLEVYMAK